ncbi:hypothetical protein HNY73_016505 [Argiope bruennichi]|uniref:Uncharacterized protein n=1 Tax=Argiope bruennichi TaxID=94029 RepID=A0A8T0EKD2_ARGBR|nr:hypothetical protein HNY73_016505 [Argiope bruennichi]
MGRRPGMPKVTSQNRASASCQEPFPLQMMQVTRRQRRCPESTPGWCSKTPFLAPPCGKHQNNTALEAIQSILLET